MPTRLTRLTYSLEHLGQSGRSIEFFPFICQHTRLVKADFRSQSPAWQTALAPATLGSRTDLHRKGKCERRALVKLAFYRNGSPEHFAERFDDVKAQSNTAVNSRD